MGDRCRLLGLLTALTLSGCSPSPTLLAPSGEADVDYDILARLPETPLDFDAEVAPILERRCIVCHGCYDAPCQLKLTSHEGLLRGASKDKVYDGSRISPMKPTRLFVDALDTPGWRALGFTPVVSEDNAIRDPKARLEASVLYKMLRLKQLHPQPRTGMLHENIDTDLDREQMCPSLREFDAYASARPMQGMPFALPNLSTREYETLVTWIAQGSPGPVAPSDTDATIAQLANWEAFLNRSDAKHRLVARYLYEHWFLAHLHFAGDDVRRFYRLVRSKTPRGEPIVPVATRRPYDPPGDRFFYRFERIDSRIVAKDHLVYEMSTARLARIRELFIEPSYDVHTLPGYEPREAANPFRTFAAIPVSARYQFMLDDARFFIEAFMKGPVCRGQVALNVIEDRFWIFFFDPEAPIATNTNFVTQLAGFLAMPTELKDNLRLISTYEHYLDLENRYLDERRKAFAGIPTVTLPKAMEAIWDGEGENPNAALTVYRHKDSASVNQGLWGAPPETAWVLDYPVFERIHYLLVAGFDVYGNVGHQLNTRMFMDVLRMEAENYFLAFLPKATRRRLHASWYEGIRRGQADDQHLWWMGHDFVTGYPEGSPQEALYGAIRERLGPLSTPLKAPPCAGDCGEEGRLARVAAAARHLEGLTSLRGPSVSYVPDVAFIRVKLGGDPKDDLAFTLLADKSYANVSFMLTKESVNERRDTHGDRQTLLPWLEGAYPNFFFVVDEAELERFVKAYQGIGSREDYERFVAQFGVRRTNTAFWDEADWFAEQAMRERPVRGGILDLNRYDNR